VTHAWIKNDQQSDEEHFEAADDAVQTSLEELREARHAAKGGNYDRAARLLIHSRTRLEQQVEYSGDLRRLKGFYWSGDRRCPDCGGNMVGVFGILLDSHYCRDCGREDREFSPEIPGLKELYYLIPKRIRPLTQYERIRKEVTE
jgi:hypothetical protein